MFLLYVTIAYVKNILAYYMILVYVVMTHVKNVFYADVF